MEAELAVCFGGGAGVGDAEANGGREILFQSLVEILQGELGEALVGGLGEEEGGVAEGGVLELGAEFEFLIGEAIVVVVPGELDGGGVRGESLDEDFAFHFAPAGAASDLGEELEGALTGAEVGNVEGEVGVEDAGEGDVGEIEAFGDHLGAEEDVDLAGFEGAECFADGTFLSGGVGVESGEAGFGEDLSEDLFDFLGAVTLEVDALFVALRAAAGDDGLVAAEVADESFFGAVVGEGEGAVLTFADVSAVGALEGTGEAAAVEEEDDLLAILDAGFDAVAEFVGEDGELGLLLLRFKAHVDDAEGLEGGGGGAEDDGAAFDGGADHGEVAAVVAGWVFLFVGVLVFLIDDE